jgi:phytoene synthase
MNELADYVARAAPPGSMRYFALLYAPATQRELLAALFVVEAEIRASTDAAHEVAHTRLQWWRGEIDRLANRNAQHPATLTLQIALPNGQFAGLHELLVAADMDLARMTYANAQELDAYLRRSGGSIFGVAAGDTDDSSVRAVGAQIRRVETLRDLIHDSKSGRVYWPLDDLNAHDVDPEHLYTDANRLKLRTLLANETMRLSAALRNFTVPVTYPLSRPLVVLAELHAKLADRIARSNHDVFTVRHELGSWEKVWTAWRAARRVSTLN